LVGELRLERYLEVLERFWRYHVALEAAVDASLAPGFRLRSNVRLLERDLRGVELRAPQRVARATPIASLGILYVLEGSALGGVAIGRRLLALPELTGRVAFFGRARQEVAERWRVFCTVLESLDAVADDFVDEAVAGAQRAFESARTTLGDPA
jgi:heme oxygenase